MSMIFINTEAEEYLHRGDTKVFRWKLYSTNNLEKQLYNLNEYDEIYFALLEPNQCWENAILKKKLTNIETDEITINFESKDTMCLIPGLYYYQIKLRSKDQVITLNNRSKLYILE